MKAQIHIKGFIGKAGDFNDSTTSYYGMKELVNAIEQAGEFTELEVTIESQGGNVVEGFAMYDLLKSLKTPITTIGKQFDSIASVIFLAGDIRKAYKGSNPLIHNAWTTADNLGDIKINSSILDSISEQYRLSDSQMLAVYSEVCGRDKAFAFSQMMKAETQLSDSDLLSLGFATEIINEELEAVRLKAVAYHPEAIKAEVQEYADVIGITTGGKVLMIQRSAESDFEASKWAFVGGKIESGEEPIKAAERELKEEIGLSVDNLELVSVMENEDGSRTHYFAGIISGVVEKQADEISAYSLLSAEECLGLDLILGQTDRYKSLINKSLQLMTNSEQLKNELSTLQKVVNGLKGLFAMYDEEEKMGASYVIPEAGISVYVDDSDGQIIGKQVLVMEDGVVSDTVAPDGNHVTENGVTLVVTDGILTEVIEPAAEKHDEEMEAKIQEAVAEKEKEMAAMQEKLEALEASNKELKSKTLEAVKNFEGQTEKITAMVEKLVGTADAEPAKEAKKEEPQELTSYQLLAARAAANFRSN